MTETLPRPLQGKRVVVTRARAQASSLVAALTGLGAEVTELPTIETKALESYEQLDHALQNIADYQWLIVTSANTVRVLCQRVAALGMDLSVFGSLRKVAIGASTAKAMQEQGIGVDSLPSQYVAESLVSAIGNQVGGDRILLPRAAVARDVIPVELTRCGAMVDAIDAYRTVIPAGAVEELQRVFSHLSRMPDVVTFTSSSTVGNFFTLWRKAGFLGLPQGVAAVSIGPVTSVTLREHGWTKYSEAKTHDVAGVIAAVTEHLI